MRANIVLIILCIGNIGCAQNETRRIFYRDPFLDSFRDRNAKVIAGSSPDYELFFDSIFLDDAGNIIRRRNRFEREWQRFDTNFFITRRLYISDIEANYLINYQLKNDTIIQRWSRLPHSLWSNADSDSSVFDREVFFVLDSIGRFRESIDKQLSEISEYTYGEKSELLSIVTCGIDTCRVPYNISYKYTQDLKLLRISYYQDGYPPRRQDFFNGDLLDSIVFPEYKMIYKVVR